MNRKSVWLTQNKENGTISRTNLAPEAKDSKSKEKCNVIEE
jgi:hypothetical protein